MVYKLLGTFIIVAAGILAYLTFQDEMGGKKGAKNAQPEESCVQLTPAQQLSKMINDDFQSLSQQGELPAQWNSIATVEIRMNSELARAILGKERPQIQRVKEGTSYLELEFMDLPDEENPGVIIQASLFDIKSKNKIFEIGRTYTMNDLNRVTPPAVAEQAPVQKEAAPSASANQATPPATQNNQSAQPSSSPTQNQQGTPPAATATPPAGAQK
ncbi:hypothetical protein QJS83_12980 [Bdellovibrio sp. 22V]|uniref:hypothetical protein n=1 Tax=Bdellovibrio TaxID=958 RepID=UPI002542888C|nr:hypothetical protein [Bdellovibrio sp. 22V]WII71377.1 hypothetical protein QJS83_12980 [Bdellovibrio sp. 22V]